VTIRNVPRERPPEKTGVFVYTAPVRFSDRLVRWARHLHWILVIALVPLVVHAVTKRSSDLTVEHRLAETIRNAPADVQEQVGRLLERNPEFVEYDELLRLLPGRRIEGAAVSRTAKWHWAMAAGTAILFLGFFAALARDGTTKPGRVVAVGVFTATVGVLFLLLVQIISVWTQSRVATGRGILVVLFYMLKLIGMSYRAAEDPDLGFVPSFFGFTAGVGLCEELCKAAPILWRFRKPPEEDWRGALLWGLASGAGFGIAEGVIYAGHAYNGLYGWDIYLVRFIS
jgi:RsiW-degrading membrane proteinase PrsW (M82 family)